MIVFVLLFDRLNAGTMKALLNIHHGLLYETFGFAGEIRDVNISNGNFCFVLTMYFHAALDNIEKMTQKSFNEIIEKYVEMNVAHPFREGN